MARSIEPYVQWVINNDLTLSPIDAEPQGSYSGHQWARQIWPTCPVCEVTINVQQLEVTTLYDASGPWIERRYMMGYWECPNECDPRPALWGVDWRTRKS